MSSAYNKTGLEFGFEKEEGIYKGVLSFCNRFILRQGLYCGSGFRALGVCRFGVLGVVGLVTLLDTQKAVCRQAAPTMGS